MARGPHADQVKSDDQTTWMKYVTLRCRRYANYFSGDDEVPGTAVAENIDHNRSGLPPSIERRHQKCEEVEWFDVWPTFDEMELSVERVTAWLTSIETADLSTPVFPFAVNTSPDGAEVFELLPATVTLRHHQRRRRRNCTNIEQSTAIASRFCVSVDNRLEEHGNRSLSTSESDVSSVSTTRRRGVQPRTGRRRSAWRYKEVRHGSKKLGDSEKGAKCCFRSTDSGVERSTSSHDDRGRCLLLKKVRFRFDAEVIL